MLIGSRSQLSNHITSDKFVCIALSEAGVQWRCGSDRTYDRTMDLRRNCSVLVVLMFLETFHRGDAEVCVLKNSCILPCSFTPGDDVLIHWIQVQGNVPVHSYYRRADQLARQNERFRFRTSLFHDQISKGNASLRLMGVKIQDQAQYKCYTSTISGNKESYVDLNVEALARKVVIQQEGNRITCSSEGIYPEPELTWSTSPPSSVTPDTLTVQQTEQQLYNINSSLILSDSVPDLDYSCTVSSGTNRRTATLFKPTSISGCTAETTISCTASDAPLTGSSLVWRFNHSQIILSQDTVSEKWEQHVKEVSASGSLKLQDLSSDQEGTYTCELIKNDETHVNSTILKTVQDCSSNSAGAAVGAVLGILAFFAAGVFIYLYIKRKKVCKKQQNSQRPEGEMLNQPTTHSQSPEQSTSVKYSDDD